MSNNPASGHDRRRWLVWLFLIGLAIRAVLFVAVRDVPTHTDDERDYIDLATNIADGHGFRYSNGHVTSMRPPLYPTFVATLWKSTGTRSLQAIRLAQILLAIGSAWLLYRLARELFDDETARWAALVWWLYPSFLYAGVLVLTEVLFAFWLLAGTLSAIRAVQPRTHSAWWAAGAGVSFALAALTRSVLWPLPIVLTPLLWALRRDDWLERARVAVVFVAAWIAVVGPWAYRNTVLQKTFVVVDTMGGLNLRMGNYEYTVEDRMWDGVSLHDEKSWSYALGVEHPDAAQWTEGQRERWARDRAVEYMAEHPGTTLRRAVLKFGDFWGLEREYIAAVKDGKYRPPPWFAVLSSSLILGAYIVTMLLASVGIPTTGWRSWQPHLLALLVVLFICGLHSIVFGHSRYHLPVMPLLMVYAVAAVRQSSWRASIARWRQALAVALVTLCVAIWAHELLLRDFDRIRQLLGAGAA